MKIGKLLKLAFEKRQTSKLENEEKKQVKDHPNWVDLTPDEKKIFHKQNINTAKLLKNIYPNWDSVDYKYFISNSYYQMKILPILNKINYDAYGLLFDRTYFTDKNFEEKLATSFKFPNCIVRCIDGDFYDKDFNYIEYSEALEKVKKYKKLVFKASLSSSHGKGVSLVENAEFDKELKNFGTNFVVQELIHQHKFLSNLNESSVNIVRITSILWKGNVYILSGVLRVGAPGAFCDHLGFKNNSPRVIGLDNDGNLYKFSVDPDNAYKYDDIFGKKIEGSVPLYKKMKQLVCEQHLKFPHHKIIGWDITVNDNNEVICIEFNSNVPGIVQSEMVCGPVFSMKTLNGNSILDEVLDSKK